MAKGKAGNSYSHTGPSGNVVGGKERAVIVTDNPSARRRSEIPSHPLFFTRIYLPSGVGMETTGMVFSSVERKPS